MAPVFFYGEIMTIKLKCAVDVEDLKKNFENFKTTKVKHIVSKPSFGSKKKKAAIICAAGPSLGNYVDRIKSLDGDVFSVKTETYLRDNDITPKYDVHVDARDSEVKYIEPNKDTTYLVSTQCHPDVFDKLKDYNTLGFNSILSADWKPPVVQASGANVTSQTIILCINMGYKEIHLFGMDCSFDKDKDSHIIWSDRRPEKPIMEVAHKESNKIYYTTPEMAGHAEELFKIMCVAIQNGCKMHIHGDGLAQNFVKDAIKLGNNNAAIQKSG